MYEKGNNDRIGEANEGSKKRIIYKTNTLQIKK